MPKISIIIPIYNSEKFLNKCIDSVLVQSEKDFELLLIDDGSTDKSGSVCDEYAKKDNRIRVIHKTNAGTASARNDALDIAKGDYIAFCDNDDYISPYFYETLLNALKETGADVVVSEMTRDSDFF